MPGRHYLPSLPGRYRSRFRTGSLPGRYRSRFRTESHANENRYKTFKSLGEPSTVAGLWHQIGIVHREAGQFAQAEDAYRQGLAIWVQQKLHANEAASLGELGNLYGQMGRLEEAVTFLLQAGEIYAKLQDLNGKGKQHSNLAVTLIGLQRYDEARPELRRAIECRKPFGHAAEL
ncbi:MAG: tetratricopeptide repeat protein [Blastocatellia bacterium]